MEDKEAKERFFLVSLREKACLDPSGDWIEVFHDQRLTGSLLDRATHHAHIIHTEAESYQFRQMTKLKLTQQEMKMLHLNSSKLFLGKYPLSKEPHKRLNKGVSWTKREFVPQVILNGLNGLILIFL